MATQCLYRRRFVRLARAAAVGLIAAAVTAFTASAVVAQQTGTIEGRVTASGSGQPVRGALVTVEGTNIGTETGEDGRYVLLNVPAGRHMLRVAAIGYRFGAAQVTVQAGQMTTANFSLTQSVLELDAVVVTGTAGQARVRELGNSIAQINLDQEVKDPPASMDQLLQARAPGLNVMQGNGMAGGGAQIRLRGAVSVSQSNQPIIYIDGVRVRSEGYERNAPPSGIDFIGRSGNIQASPLNDINPADVERIEVIKGSAASTLYGTEAAAGVIQIFTRKGSRGAPRWNVQIDQGIANLRPFGTDAEPFVRLRPKDNVQGFCPDEVAKALEVFEQTGSAPDVSNCSWIRNGYRQKYAGSVTGGFEDFQYFVSGSWEDYDNVLPQDTEQKLVARGNFTFDVSEKIRFDWNSAYTNYDVRNTPAGNNAQGLTLNVYRAERNYRQSSDPIVLDSLLNQSITTEINRLISGGTAHYSPFPWFTNRLTIGLDLAHQENRNLRPFGFVSAPEGRLFDEQIRFTTLTADYVGNADYRLSDELAATFSFGGQSITEERVRTFGWGRGFAGPGEPTVSQAATFIAQEDRIRVVNAGFFFQNVFKLKDRYFLTGGVRIDGNSAFGEALGLQAYPKASLSYVMSEEPWWPSGLGEVKLRGAIGWSGRAPGAFDKVRTWEALPFAGQPSLVPDNVGNPEVGPERTREIEFGFDAAWLDNRLSTEFTWYHQKTTDALFSVRQIPSLGFLSSQNANVGAIRNAGIEAAINATIVNKPSWGLDIGTTFFTNHSLVLDLGVDAGGNPVAPFPAGFGWIEEGFPVMAANGIKIKNEDQIAAPDTACIAGTDPCNVNGEWMFGPQQPTFIWTHSVTLRLPRGVTVSARGEYQGGAWIFDGPAANALGRSVLWPTCKRALDILAAGGTVDDFTARERIECDLPIADNRVLWFPQDFWKLRDLTLTVPVEFLVPQASSATFSFTVQNYFRWINSDLRMFDPEMTNRDSLDDQNRQISEHVPPPAIITASLRVTF